MTRNSVIRLGTVSAATIAAVGGLIVSSASGALPKPGKLYTGYVARTVYNDFTAPVSFTVSRKGRQLLRFTWASGGCTGLGGPGNAWTSPYLNYKVGTINVSRSGTFSVRNVKSTNTQGRLVKVTISTVKGRFKTPTTATGTIYYTQKVTKTCTGKANFTAVLGPAPGAFHKTAPVNGASVQPSGATISWSASRNATKYQYCLATRDGTCNRTWVSTGTSTHATLGGLTAGTTYYWQVKASSTHGTVAADKAAWWVLNVSAGAPVKPMAGSWRATALSGPVSGSGAGGSVTATSIFFTVAADRVTVSSFGFGYDYSGIGGPPTYSCSGSGSSSESAPSPISRAKFSTPDATGPWTGSASGMFNGTFDSATTAHGTATMSAFISGPGCLMTGTSSTGTFSWTATHQG